jgi:hypothetical protein
VIDWSERQQQLGALVQRQLFFVGGAPRSGTTWLQQLLDAHPQVSCRGEGLFWRTFAEPLDSVVAKRRETLASKNKEVFGDAGGYPPPAEEDPDMLFGTAVLLALDRQRAGKACLAVGEKTPENVFLFPRLKRLFPRAKFIGLARDPRDVLTSAWHFFGKKMATGPEIPAKITYIQTALPSLNSGGKAMLALPQQYPSDCLNVTYERLRADTVPVAARLFRFLGVSDAADVVAACVTKTSFSALAGGRSAGVAQNGAFYRKGVSGDWPSTLTPEMNQIILAELGWMFPHFGWQL